MERMVVDSGSDVSFGLLRDLFDQLEAGKQDMNKGLTGLQLRTLLEHANPFDRNELVRRLPYATERVTTTKRYSQDGYRSRTVEEQLQVWRQLRPGLDESHVVGLATDCMPGSPRWEAVDSIGSETQLWFPAVCPKPKFFDGIRAGADAMAKHLKRDENFKERVYFFGKASIQHVLDKRTKAFHDQLNDLPGDYWVFLCQLGVQFAGTSQRLARAEMEQLTGDYPLSAYEGLALLVTHPDRLCPGNLDLDLPGSLIDEAEWGVRLYANNVMLEYNPITVLDIRPVLEYSECCASASGLPPVIKRKRK